MTISEKIKSFRISLGMEQIEFAKLLNVSSSTVSNWETSRRVPRIPKLKKMVDIAKDHKIKLSMQDFFSQ